jgi:biotin carboxylase
MGDRKKLVQVLGAGRLQVKTISAILALGHEVLAVDYYPDAPGKELATYRSLASAADIEANLELARRYRPDAVLTTGTDQPLLAVSRVAEELGLPRFISSETAYAVTNKSKMRRVLAAARIPCPEFAVIAPADERRLPAALAFPVVLKPADSQGQRGVLKCDSEDDFEALLEAARSFSSTGEVVADRFLEGNEITVNAWADRGSPRLLLVTDRITYGSHPHLGVCIAHLHPSRHASPHLPELEDILRRICAAFRIESGPIYAQLMVTSSGPKVIEFSCRIGGGHEEDLIPLATGFDIRMALIRASLGDSLGPPPTPTALGSGAVHCGVIFVGAHKGRVAHAEPMASLVHEGLIVQGEWYVRPGQEARSTAIGPDRIGAYLCRGDSRQAILSRWAQVQGRLAVRDAEGRNLVRTFRPEELHGL